MTNTNKALCTEVKYGPTHRSCPVCNGTGVMEASEPSEIKGDQVVSFEESLKLYFGTKGNPEAVEALRKAHQAALDEAVRAARIELMQKLHQVYTELEADKPPMGLVTQHEADWNEGVYRSRLGTIETICRRVFGVHGDELVKLTSDNVKC